MMRLPKRFRGRNKTAHSKFLSGHAKAARPLARDHWLRLRGMSRRWHCLSRPGHWRYYRISLCHGNKHPNNSASSCHKTDSVLLLKAFRQGHLNSGSQKLLSHAMKPDLCGRHQTFLSELYGTVYKTELLNILGKGALHERRHRDWLWQLSRQARGAEQSLPDR
jgi:hypothetical protein